MRALVAILILSAPAAAQSGFGQYIPGRAVNALTQMGIARIQAVLAPLSGDARPLSVMTDIEGQFLFRNVRAGAYTFTCVSGSYVPATSGRITKIQVTEGQPPLRLECDMTPLPRLMGRVVDGNGKPVAGARVSLLDPGSHQGPIVTDEHGRINWPLRPGSYAFFVDPPAGLRPPSSDPASANSMVWTRTYYPGTRFRDGALKVTMRIGERLPEIEVKLAAAPGYTLHGTLLTEFGRPARDTEITLSGDGSPGGEADDGSADGVRTKSGVDGSFTFTGVPDGEWNLAASDRFRAASEWFEVRGADVDDLRVRMSGRLAIRGRVVLNDRGRGSPMDFPGKAGWTPEIALMPHIGPLRISASIENWMLVPDLGIGAAPGDDGAAASQAAAALRTRLLDDEGAIRAGEPRGRDGEFGMGPVFAGTYRVAVTPPPEPWYVDSIRVGVADVATAETEISSALTPITVVYGSHGGAVQGKAASCAGGYVVLMPREPARQWFGFVHSVWCDASDHYRIGAVRPGDYSITAITGAAPPVLDPDVLKQGMQVTVGAGQTTSMDLVAVQPF